MTSPANAALLRAPVSALANRAPTHGGASFVDLHSAIANAQTVAESVRKSIPSDVYLVPKPARPLPKWENLVEGVGGAVVAPVMGLTAGAAVSVGAILAIGMTVPHAPGWIVEPLFITATLAGLALAVGKMWPQAWRTLKAEYADWTAKVAKNDVACSVWSAERRAFEQHETFSEAKLEPLKALIANAPDPIARRCIEGVVGEMATRMLRDHGNQLTQGARAWLMALEHSAPWVVADHLLPPEAKLAFTVATKGPDAEALGEYLPEIAPNARRAIAAWIESSYFFENGRLDDVSRAGLEERVLLKRAQAA